MTTLPKKLSARAQGAAKFARAAITVGSKLAERRWVETQLPGDYSPQATDRFVACAYFSSDLPSVYQLEQWLWAFERCADRLRESGYGDEPFGIIVRDPIVARHVRAKTQIPVRFSRISKGLEAFMSSPSLRVVLYVNQARGNFQALRFPKPAHVHLSHGESEKISMISNQLKAYDYVFTAGAAARARILDTLIGMRDDHMVDVGRPSLDQPRTIPRPWIDFDSSAPTGPAVFWAPTWEGDSVSMAYGTLSETGEPIADSLLTAGYRVIFRSHPRTGSLDPAFRRALGAVEARLDGHPRGFIDRSPSVGWQFDVAEAAVAEMSSVAFDWLSTRKPLVMVPPHTDGAEILPAGLLSRTPCLEPGGEAKLGGLLRSALGEDRAAEIDELSSYYLGVTEPGSQIARFLDATESVIRTRSAALAERFGR